MDSFDVDVFISEVEARPAIWDLRSDAYSDRGQKTKAWEELCLLFISKFDEMVTAKKNKAAAQLQRRWKSLRDSYNREVGTKKHIKSGSGASSSRKEYIYFQQLSFLSALSNVRPENTEEDVLEPTECTSPTPELPSPTPERPKVFNKKARLSKIEHMEQEILQHLSENVKRKVSADGDADRNFFLSLIPDFKKIREEFQLDAKTEIMNVIKKYKNYTHPGYGPNFSYQHPMPYQPQASTSFNNQCYSQGHYQQYTTSSAASPTNSESMSTHSTQSSILEVFSENNL